MTTFRLIGLIALASQGLRLLAPCYCSSHDRGQPAAVETAHSCCQSDSEARASLRAGCCCDDRESGNHPAVSAPDAPQTHLAHPAVLAAGSAPPILEVVAEPAPARSPLPDVLLAGFTPDLRGPPC